MPRRKAAVKREVLPDPLYSSDEVAKFINVVMRAGKKSIAERIVYDALSMLTDRLKKEKDKSDSEGGDDSKGGKGGKGGKTTSPTTSAKAKTSSREYTHEEVLETLHRSLTNVAPTVEVKSRRMGGATYQVPIEVTQD